MRSVITLDIRSIVKTGRTHLMDANASHTRTRIWWLRNAITKWHSCYRSALEDIYELALGGTAVGMV